LEIRGQQLQIKSAKDMKVYQKAYALAMEIFQLSKSWPSEDKSASYHRMQTNWIYARLNAQQAGKILAPQNRPLTSNLCSLNYRLKDGRREVVILRRCEALKDRRGEHEKLCDCDPTSLFW
jgi:hypothetical protein